MLACLGGSLWAGAARADTVTFNSTGAAQTFTVPTGVSSVTFDVYGGQGGTGCTGGGTGGLGGQSTLTVATSAGTVYQLNVGGAGAISAGGFGGGGAGSTGGGGGGASDVRTGAFGLADRIAVGGGGGGCSSSNNGGAGGGASAGAGSGFGAGTGATQLGPGTAGSSGTGTAGSSGTGGGGGALGGGGGGGYFGGGGGSGFGGTLTAGVNTGAGRIVVTYTVTATVAAAAGPTTSVATGIDRRSATLHGSCASASERYPYEWGKTTSYGNLTTVATSSGAGADLAWTLSDLKPDTTYHFRIVSTNGNGTDLVFTTSAHVLAPDTLAASGATTTTATLHGVPHTAGVAYHFEYGRSHIGYDTATASTVVASADADFSAALTGLLPGTTYYFRIVADGEASGQELTFTTAALVPDLSVDLTGPASGPQGGTFTYIATVKSTGTGSVPAGTGIQLRWIGKGATHVVSSPGCIDTGGWLVCPTAGALAPGESTTFTIVVRSKARGTVHVETQVDAVFADPTPADDSDSLDSAVTAKRA